MGRDTTAFKRLIVGRPKRNEDLGDTLLQKRIALPVFSSDALSSVAYATEAILKVLTLGRCRISTSRRGSAWPSWCS